MKLECLLREMSGNPEVWIIWLIFKKCHEMSCQILSIFRVKAFGKEATAGGFEVFIFKDCHLMGLGEFHRDVTRPHPKFDREVGEAPKLSLLEVGEWLQNYGYFLCVKRFQLLVHIFLFLFLFVYKFVNIILAPTA